MSEDKYNKDFGTMKTAADILTKGGTLIKEPCDICRGVQVRLMNKLTCVNCGRIKEITESSNLRTHELKDNRLTKNSKEASKSRDGDSVPDSELNDISVARIKSRILDLITDIRDNETISEELSRARLIGVYLSILERLTAL